MRSSWSGSSRTVSSMESGRDSGSAIGRKRQRASALGVSAKVCQMVRSVFERKGLRSAKLGDIRKLLSGKSKNKGNESSQQLSTTNISYGNVTFEKKSIDALQARVGDRASARIIASISRTATELAKEGDKTNPCKGVTEGNIPEKGSLTIELNGANQPKISLEDYLCHLVLHYNAVIGHETSEDSAGIRAILMATIYLERLRALNPSFVINSFNIHRVFLTASLVAMKIAEDDHPLNDYVAKFGGIDLVQMNFLESCFCSGLGFSLSVSLKELSEVYDLFDPEHPHGIIAPTGI